ncbi:unnamed protein product [Mytilus coruscus]|uniref:Mab-21-like HhH/H2TH-like domain-containing protein n=1 Tax=Mytilus coruscus TaxID=42192 RepID=A0A6J8E5I6_MYTCO|nr:unnamed protein product [Mytilus coruscus]
MSMDKNQSLIFYKFLCEKIGSEVVVRTRRIHSIISDIGAAEQKRITSGSNGEGLNFKSSDIDFMFLDPAFKVYESERNVVHQDLSIPFIMDIEDTQPCFTRLRLFNDEFYSFIEKNASVLLKNGRQNLLSSELYKLYHLKRCCFAPIFKIHGPCLSDRDDRFDLAYCLKCDKWVSLAKSWITRSRKWPSPDVISKITSCGVLTRLSREIFTLQLSKASQCVSKYFQRQHGENNRNQYFKYRNDLSNFLLGLSTDAVSGWLLLASFFYVHKKYSTSLKIIDHALSKCTDEKIYFQPRNCPFSQIQESVLKLMKREKLYTVLKTLTVQNIIFDWQSFVIPPELQLDVTWNGKGVVSYAPIPFAYFLKFLCHYNLHEEFLCKHWLRKLMSSVRTCRWGVRLFSTIHSKIFAGIACQMLGEIDNARFFFVEASISDFNISSARYRLSHF